MAIWAIADLHLCFARPDKNMDRFGPQWVGHAEKIAANWRSCVGPGDLVLVAGDISWAMRLPEAKPDLDWLDSLPGKTLLIRGNHDYWWPQSASKLTQALPSSLHPIHHNHAFHWGEISVAGARLWELPGVSFDHIAQGASVRMGDKGHFSGSEPDSEKLLAREIQRLTRSLEDMPSTARFRICMTHFPPISADLNGTTVSELIESFGVHVALFGHLHAVRPGMSVFGTKNTTRYLLASADYLEFSLCLVLP